MQLELARTCFTVSRHVTTRTGFDAHESIVFPWFFQGRRGKHGSAPRWNSGEEMAEIWDLLGKERKSSLPRGTRINSIPRWIQESVPRKYEIGEHKFVRIYGRPRTNVSTSGRVLPALGPPSTSESISQVLHPPSKGTLPPLETFLGTRAPFIISFFLPFFLFFQISSISIPRTFYNS